MRFSKLLLTPILFIAFTGPARSDAKESSKKHDQKECAMDHASARPDFKKMAEDSFASAPGLTEVQRTKLLEILRKTATEAIEIRKQIGEAKTDLFKAASSKAFASKEVTEIRDKITQLDQKRLVVMYKALEDVQAVVGFGPDKEEIYRRLRDYDNPREGRMSRSSAQN